MGLSDFIVANVGHVVDEWESFARTIAPEPVAMDRTLLRDHARAILLAAARDMTLPQTGREQAAKAKGDGPDNNPALDQASASHGELRHNTGFDLVQMTAEFRHLRACVIRLWLSLIHI